jgi:hypothetical protein
MKESSWRDFEYPHGPAWKKLFDAGKYRDPSLEFKMLT